MAKRKRTTSRPKADTQDVLGRPLKKPPIAPKWQKHYQHLETLRDRLVRQKDDLVKDARSEQPAFSLHMADAGTDNYDLDFALSRISSEQNALYEIEQAMSRIRNGTYGVCEMTGKPIEPQRLKAIPWTRFSAEAEQRLEKEGVADRVRLGERERIPKQSTEHQVGEEQE